MRGRGADILVECLVEQGVERIFGIPGTHVLAIYDALYKEGTIDVVLTRQEASAAFMADACGRLTGEPGVCLATAGPGLTSLLNGVAEAFVESSPVVVLGGAVPYHTFGRGYYHELRHVDDQIAFMRPFTKWQSRVESVGDVPDVVAQAFTEATRERPRPVFVELPKDVMEDEGEAKPKGAEKTPRKKADASRVEEALSLLREAERPLILAGGGVHISGAWEEIRELAEALGAPLATTITGKGSIPADHPLHIGLGCGLLAPPEVRDVLLQMDVLLAVGCRFDEIASGGWTLPAPERIIHVNVDPGDIDRVYDATVALVGDVKAVTEDLLAALKGVRKKPWFTLEKRPLSEDDGEGIGLGLAVRALREVLPRDAIVTCDSGNSQVAMFDFDVYKPRTYLSPTGFNAMGFAVPAAIGAQMVRRQRKVAAVFGDGAFFMNGMELLTAVERELPISFFLFNDRSYGILKFYQDLMYDGRRTGVEMPSVNLLSLAEGLGIEFMTARSRQDVPRVFKDAIRSDSPTLIDVRVDPSSGPPPLERAYRPQF
ncbi:MAG: thiamine pyrophosphate-binding protein [Thermoplasmata archaeon]